MRWLEPEVLAIYRVRAARLDDASLSEQTTCRKTYKEKLKPTPTQEREVEHVLWHCRALSHTALEQRITAWQRCHVSLTRSQQEAELKAIREEFPHYAAIHSQVRQDGLARLDKTYQAFFRRVQNGAKPGFPRFHGQDRYHSLTSQEYGNGARLDNGALVLSKIGRMAVRWSRPIQGTIKTVTSSQAVDGWYVSCSCAEVPSEPLPLTGRATGSDVGLTVFLITAKGNRETNPRHYRTAERERKKAPQRVSGRKKGSTRRRTAVQVLTKQPQHVRRQRSDFPHKTALARVRQDDVLDVEAIQPATLRRRPTPKPDTKGTGSYQHHGASCKAGLTKSSQDAWWRHFLTIRAFKAACAGKHVEAVPPAYTTQDGSGCGERSSASLSVRTHICTRCGLNLDRAANAARNSHWRGQRLRGVPAVAGAMNREPVGL